GLKPVGIDVEPLAASRCLLDANPNAQPGRTVAIINIGASNTDLGIFRDKLLAFPRTLPIAGDNFTRAIADALQVDLTTAETYKRDYGEVLLDQFQQPAPNFGGGFADPAGGFMDFSSSGTGPATPSGPMGVNTRMPFDFTSPNEAPPPTAEPSPFDLSGN